MERMQLVVLLGSRVAMTYLTLLCFSCLVGYNFSSATTENTVDEISWPYFESSSLSSSVRRDVPDDSREMDDKVKVMMEKQWLKILHLSKVPEDVPRNVPEYMQALFSMIETNASASVKLEPSISGERAALAIKAFEAHHDNDNFSTYFNVFLECNSNMISRVELVFEGSSDSERPPNQRRAPQNARTTVEVSGVNCTACHHSGVAKHRRLDGAKSTYDIYDLTLPFVQWWASVESCKSCVVHITVSQSPFIESFTFVNNSDLLLIIYQNMTPDIKLSRKILRRRGTLSVGQHQPDVLHPVLAPTVAHNRSTRFRRDVRRDSSTFCQLHEWYIDFRSLGWNWIIVPNAFGANFCDGSCPTLPNDLEQVNLTNHAFLRTVHRAILGPTHGKDGIPIPASTCVPIRYRPLSILYKANNETFIVRSLVDMVATSCGCL